MSALPSQRTPPGALIPGGVSQNLVLPNEDPAEFEALVRDLLAEYQPETTHHHILVEQVALSHWLLWRRQRAVNCVEAAIYGAENAQALWMKSDYERLERVERSKIQAELSLNEPFRTPNTFGSTVKPRPAAWSARPAGRPSRIFANAALR